MTRFRKLRKNASQGRNYSMRFWATHCQKRESFYAIFVLLSNEISILSNNFFLTPSNRGFLSRGLRRDRVAPVFRPTTLLTLVLCFLQALRQNVLRTPSLFGPPRPATEGRSETSKRRSSSCGEFSVLSSVGLQRGG